MGDGFQMIRMYARSGTAKVVKLKPGRNTP